MCRCRKTEDGRRVVNLRHGICVGDLRIPTATTITGGDDIPNPRLANLPEAVPESLLMSMSKGTTARCVQWFVEQDTSLKRRHRPM